MKNQITLLFLIVATFMGCSKSSESGEAPEHTIDQIKVSLNYDKRHQYTVSSGVTSIDAKTLKWTSSEESVGTISATGLFEAKKIGKTTINITGNGFS